MTPVILHTNFNFNIGDDRRYWESAAADCLERSEAPYAISRQYFQFHFSRNLYAKESLAIDTWLKLASKLVIYCDLGIDRKGICLADRAFKFKKNIEFRNLPLWTLYATSLTQEEIARLNDKYTHSRKLSPEYLPSKGTLP